MTDVLIWCLSSAAKAFLVVSLAANIHASTNVVLNEGERAATRVANALGIAVFIYGIRLVLW